MRLLLLLLLLIQQRPQVRDRWPSAGSLAV
jgi:hypothetical protein